MTFDPKTQFRCSHCREVFDKNRPDEVAMEEAKAQWGAELEQNPSVMCEDCYQAFMKWYEANKHRYQD